MGSGKEKRDRKKVKIGIILAFIFIFIGATNMNAAGLLGIGNTASWKEEVLLHDGSKIIVERWQKHGGRHEPFQKSGIAERSIAFTLPGTNQLIKWKDEYSEDIGRSGLKLLAMDVINGSTYIITNPVGCLAYNKWGRPNPPYVIYKFTKNEWKIINMSNLPSEFNNINLVIDTLNNEEELVKQSLISALMVRKLNSSLTQVEYKTVIRTPLDEKDLCPDWSSPRYTSPKAPFPILPKGNKESSK